jgi:hypothetical protein
MTEHVIGLSLEEQKAFMELALAHTVGVVNLKEAVDRKKRIRSDGSLGTGSACLWNNKAIVLTARHVLDEASPGEVAFLPRAETSLKWDAPGQTSGVAERVVLEIERIVRSESEDLAAIVLKSTDLNPLNCEFCPLPQRLAADMTAKGEGSVLLAGFPVDQTYTVLETRNSDGLSVSLGCPSVLIWGEIVHTPPRPLDSHYDPDRHILIRFEPPSPGSRPQGYSGAAVWCDPSRRGRIWRANPLLLGVETRAYEKSGLLLAIRASVVRRFLEESL